MATTYKLVVEKIGGTDPSTFKPKVGEIFYDPTTGTLKVSDGATAGGNGLPVSLAGTVTGHLIPDTNDAYDLGSAEKKFRDMYLSDNTIHTESGSISTENNVLSYNGEPVILESHLKSLVADSTSWEDFQSKVEEL